MGKRISKNVCRIMAFLMSVIMGVSMIPVDTFAAKTDDEYVTEGTYHFSSTNGSTIQCEDTFEYRDDCFMRSSFLGCEHLSLLSSQLAISSVTWNQQGHDQKDCSTDATNVKEFLTNAGFEDVQTNKFYTVEMQENSMGVAVGHRTIKAFGKDYTLLAIAPRGAGYRQEWSGNLMIDSGGAHDGFRTARDEVLRYIKKYVQDNGITGNLKLWIAGYSRGAAVANMVGGFFASGGVDYLGSDYSLTPEDIYCYTYATPATVKSTLTKAEFLSVAPSGQLGYADDTPGEAYTYTGAGGIDAKGDEFGGIRNFRVSADPFTQLPLESWDYERFGTDIVIDKDLGISPDDMKVELQAVDPSSYQSLIDGGDFRDFKWKKLDPLNMTMVDDDSIPATDGLSTFTAQRLAGMASKAPTSDEFIMIGYEDALRSLAATVGMMETNLNIDPSKLSLVKPVLFTYLSYASKKLQEEGRAASENEAAAIALEDVIAYITGEPIDHSTFTIDQFLAKLAKYLIDNKDSKLTQTVLSGIAGAIPDMYKPVITSAFGMFSKDVAEGKTVTVEEVLASYFYACAYGPEEGSQAATDPDRDTPEESRRVLYILLSFISGVDYDVYKATIGTNTEGDMDGSGSFTGGVGLILSMLMTEKDANITFNTFDEAADYYLCALADQAFTDVYENLKNKKGVEYADTFWSHVDNLKSNVKDVRGVVTDLLFENAGQPYDTESIIRNIATAVGNGKQLALTHYGSAYMCYMKVFAKSGGKYVDHYIEHEDPVAAACETDGILENWHLYDADGDTYYLDKYLGEKVAKDKLVVNKLGHLAGAAVRENVIEPTYEKAGSYEEVTYCKHCGKELSRVKVEIPPKSKDPDDPVDPTPAPAPTPTPDNNSGDPAKKSSVSPGVSTGDDSPLAICFVVMMISMVGAASTFVLKKKK